MVVTTLWRKSRKFRPLSKDAKLLYLYLITNEDTELCGAYEQHWDDLHRWADLSSQEAEKAFAELEQAGLAAYRDGWVLVPHYKVLGSNPSVEKGIESGLAALPEWVKGELERLKQSVDSVGQAVPTLAQTGTDLDLDSEFDNDSEEEGGSERSDHDADLENGPSTAPQESPPDGGGATAPLSPLKDPLANHYQQRFVEVQPSTSWGNVAKERGQIATLAKKTRALRPDTPFENDVGLANAILGQFMALRRRERSEFWRNAPFSPSGLATRWDQVVTALAHTHARAERDREGEEVLSWLNSG